MTFVGGVQRFACPHFDVTAEDQDGRAICERCGAVLTVVSVDPRVLADAHGALIRRRGLDEFLDDL